VHFNVAGAVPAGSRIVSATLQLYISRTLAANFMAIEVYRVNADWGEGTSVASGNQGRGAPATTNDATWLHRFYPNTFWVSPGGDFQDILSTVCKTPISGPAVWPSTPRLLADVQLFLDQPTQNFGWLLKRDNELAIGETRRFDSRENTTISRRPILSITYLPPGAVLAVGTGCVGSNSQPLVLAGQGAPGPSFALQLTGGRPGALAAHGVGLALAAPPLPLYPDCSLLLDPALGIVTHAVVFLDASGSASTPYPVPNGFHGLEVDFQSLALDAGLTAGFVLSNALRLVGP
jgi:hypothetical protein